MMERFVNHQCCLMLTASFWWGFWLLVFCYTKLTSPTGLSGKSLENIKESLNSFNNLKFSKLLSRHQPPVILYNFFSRFAFSVIAKINLPYHVHNLEVSEWKKFQKYRGRLQDVSVCLSWSMLKNYPIIRSIRKARKWKL